MYISEMRLLFIFIWLNGLHFIVILNSVTNFFGSKRQPENAYYHIRHVCNNSFEHGRILFFGANTLANTESIDSFTCTQLKYHEIGYEHDDSENFDDRIRLKICIYIQI